MRILFIVLVLILLTLILWPSEEQPYTPAPKRKDWSKFVQEARLTDPKYDWNKEWEKHNQDDNN